MGLQTSLSCRQQHMMNMMARPRMSDLAKLQGSLPTADRADNKLVHASTKVRCCKRAVI